MKLLISGLSPSETISGMLQRIVAVMWKNLIKVVDF